MKQILIGALVTGGLLISSMADARSYQRVYNGNNDGAGSLRAALDNGATTIKINRSVSTISLTEPLYYNGERKLSIIGSGQMLDGSALVGNADIFTVSNGADLSLSNLNFVGNMNEVNEVPSNPVGGKGIYVSVPVNRTGVVKVSLDNIFVTRVGNHGVHISDCTLGDDCGGGSGGGGEGSPASVYVNANKLTINKVGFGKSDADGLRVDDRGEGSIYFYANNSSFLNVGADGVELDEGNDGFVVADVRNSLFDSNGEYCNLIPFVAGGPCDDDGDRDVDDGFDIDEAGAGSLFARIRNTRVTNNFDEGLDFDEEDGDSIQVWLANVYAAGNEDEAIKMSEEDDGDLRAFMRSVTTVNNNGSKEGIELEEEGVGDVAVTVLDSNMIGGGDEELKVEQGDEGVGTLKIRRSTIGALDLDNVDEI